MILFQKDPIEALRVAYVTNLCSVAKSFNNIGPQKFHEPDYSFLSLNPVLHMKKTCSDLRTMKRRCRKIQSSKANFTQPFLQHGPPSELFSSISLDMGCNVNVCNFVMKVLCDFSKKMNTKISPYFFLYQVHRETTKERLARLLCYNAEVFMKLLKRQAINQFDYGFGIMNTAFGFQKSCTALYYRRATCFQGKTTR